MKIFVFGSNLAGRHGRGSALEAFKNHGAVYGEGVGFWGHSWAIPTKDHRLKILPLGTIQMHVEIFVAWAKKHPEHEFNIVAIGCGLAGYQPHEIAPMFKDAPSNCNLPVEFREALLKKSVENPPSRDSISEP